MLHTLRWTRPAETGETVGKSCVGIHDTYLDRYREGGFLSRRGRYNASIRIVALNRGLPRSRIAGLRNIVEEKLHVPQKVRDIEDVTLANREEIVGLDQQPIPVLRVALPELFRHSVEAGVYQARWAGFPVQLSLDHSVARQNERGDPRSYGCGDRASLHIGSLDRYGVVSTGSVDVLSSEHVPTSPFVRVFGKLPVLVAAHDREDILKLFGLVLLPPIISCWPDLVCVFSLVGCATHYDDVLLLGLADYCFELGRALVQSKAAIDDVHLALDCPIEGLLQIREIRLASQSSASRIE